jgi:predicted aspartyl protease
MRKGLRSLTVMMLTWLGTVAYGAVPIADVPIRYIKGSVVVDHVRIDGRGDYTFLVDTGSTACTVTTDVANDLGLQRDGWSDVSGIGASRKLRIVRTHSIGISGASVSSPLTLIADDNGLSKHIGFPIHGVLGTPFLWKWPVQVDYPGRRLRVYPREHDIKTEPVESPWSSVGKLVIRNRAAFALASLNNAQPREMMLDTGATGVVISDDRAKEVKAQSAPWQSTFVGAFGPRRESHYWRIATIRLAGLTVENTQAFTPQHLGDWKSDQIGNDALDQFRLTIDAGRCIFRLDRDEIPDSFGNSPWGAGVTIRRDVDAIRVASVWANGDAAAMGIAPGDTLISVDDVDAESINPDTLYDLLNQPRDYVVMVRVKSPDGFLRSVQIRSQRYARKRPSDAIATSVSVVQPKKAQ